MSSQHNSLRWRSGVNLVVIAAALVAITVITNAYSFNLMLRNFRQSLSNTAQIYTEQISGKVDKINSGSLELVSLAASSQNYYTSSPLGRYLTQQDILTRLQDRVRYVESSDLYFFYRTDSDELLTALSNRPSTGSSYFWNQYLMLPPTQCNLVRRTEKGRLRRRGWGLRWEKAQKGGKGTNLRGFFED